MDLNIPKIKEILPQYNTLKDFDIFFAGFYRAINPDKNLETLIQSIKNVSDMEKNKSLDNAEKLNFFLTFLKKQANLQKHELIVSDFEGYYKKVKNVFDSTKFTDRCEIFLLGYFQGRAPDREMSEILEYLSDLNEFVKNQILSSENKEGYLKIAAVKIEGLLLGAIPILGRGEDEKRLETDFIVDVPQIIHLTRENSTIINFDLYYLGFYHGLAPSSNLSQLFHYLKNIIDMETSNLIDSANRMNLMQSFLNKIKDMDVEFAKKITILADGITKLLAGANLTNQFEVFYLGLYSAMHKQNNLSDLMLNLDKALRMERNGFIGFTEKIHLFTRLINCNLKKPIRMMYKEDEDSIAGGSVGNKMVEESKDSRIHETRNKEPLSFQTGPTEQEKKIRENGGVELHSKNELFDFQPHKRDQQGREVPSSNQRAQEKMNNDINNLTLDSRSMDIEESKKEKSAIESKAETLQRKDIYSDINKNGATHMLKMHKPTWKRDDSLDNNDKTDDFFMNQIKNIGNRNLPVPVLSHQKSTSEDPGTGHQGESSKNRHSLTSVDPKEDQKDYKINIVSPTKDIKKVLINERRSENKGEIKMFEEMREVTQFNRRTDPPPAPDKSTQITNKGYKRISTNEEEELTQKYLNRLEEEQKGNDKKPARITRKIPTREEEQLSLAFITQLQEEEEKNQADRVKKRLEQDNAEAVCSVCFNVLVNDNFRILENCDHIYHDSCLAEFLKMKIDERKFPLLCPSEDCKKEITKTDMKGIIDDKYEDKYYEYSLKIYIDTHQNDLLCCPTPDCKYAFVKDPHQPRFNCPLCGMSYCMNCKVKFHVDMSCKEYELSSNKDENDLMFERYVSRMNFKQCPKCRAWVERIDGCDHMACTCGYAFCYNCGRNKGKESDGLDHDCRCGGGEDGYNEGEDDEDDDDEYDDGNYAHNRRNPYD